MGARKEPEYLTSPIKAAAPTQEGGTSRPALDVLLLRVWLGEENLGDCSGSANERCGSEAALEKHLRRGELDVLKQLLDLSPRFLVLNTHLLDVSSRFLVIAPHFRDAGELLFDVERIVLWCGGHDWYPSGHYIAFGETSQSVISLGKTGRSGHREKGDPDSGSRGKGSEYRAIAPD